MDKHHSVLVLDGSPVLAHSSRLLHRYFDGLSPANMPFETARLFKVVEGREPPSSAHEIGATIWAAFFLKWVISHPNVTCALPSISNPARRGKHRRLRGPLPNCETRARVVRYHEPELEKDCLLARCLVGPRHRSGA
jgi:hypothetical protein